MMSSVQACEKCSLNIDMDTEDYTVCDGKCDKSFHAKCVGLSATTLDLLSSNVLWMCDSCVEDFCTYRGRRTNDVATNTNSPATHATEHATINDEIKHLKAAVADIAEKLAKITHKEPLNSTPISSPILLDGTNEPCDIIENKFTPRTSTSTSSHTEECFSLYLTNIDRFATEADICQMVSRSLAAPLSSCNEVVKLVPKGKNVSTLEYISFKVVLDMDWKQSALNPATWPKGVKFREFVNQLDQTWKPN